MKTNYLFPAIFRKIGWILLIPFTVLGIYCLWNFGDIDFQIPSKGIVHSLLTVGEEGVLDEITIVGLTLSLLFVSFSREKDEDECIARIRMDSLVWAILVNYVLVILATMFIYGMAYLDAAFISMFTVLIIFIIKYNWVLHHFRKTELSDE